MGFALDPREYVPPLAETGREPLMLSMQPNSRAAGASANPGRVAMDER